MEGDAQTPQEFFIGVGGTSPQTVVHVRGRKSFRAETGMVRQGAKKRGGVGSAGYSHDQFASLRKRGWVEGLGERSEGHGWIKAPSGWEEGVERTEPGKLVAGGGFEPPTLRVWAACSNQLSYPAPVPTKEKPLRAAHEYAREGGGSQPALTRAEKRAKK